MAVRFSKAWLSLEEMRVRADARAVLQLVRVVEGDVNDLAGPEKASAVGRIATAKILRRDVGQYLIAA
jgi:hypothetical protein